MSQQPQSGSDGRGPQDLDIAIAGGSLGGIVAGIANTFPDGWPKTITIICAPLLAVGISTAGAQLRRWANKRLNRRRAKSAFAVAEATLLKLLEDENTSAERKERARTELEELRQLDIDTHVEEARSRLRKRYDDD